MAQAPDERSVSQPIKEEDDEEAEVANEQVSDIGFCSI